MKILPEAKEVVRYYKGWKELSSMDSVRQIDIYAQAAFVHFFLPDILLRFKKAYPFISRVNPLLDEKLTTVPIKGHERRRPVCLFFSDTAYKRHPALRELIKDMREVAKELSGI